MRLSTLNEKPKSDSRNWNWFSCVYVSKLFLERKLFRFDDSGYLCNQDSECIRLKEVFLKRPIGPYFEGDRFNHIIIDYKNEKIRFYIEDSDKNPVYEATLQLMVSGPDPGYMP